MEDKISIDLIDYNYLKQTFPDILKNKEYNLVKKIIIQVLNKYNIIKETDKYDNCKLLNYIIIKINEILRPRRIRNILQTIIIDDMTLLDYVYYNNLFFLECDLVTLLFKNNVKFNKLNNTYIINVFNHYNKLFENKDDKDKLVTYQIIKSCSVIEKITNKDNVIDSLINLFTIIKKEDYDKYKCIYMNLPDYNIFYNKNKDNKDILYFMIDILFMTMLEKMQFNSMYYLMKTIINNRELLSYLRKYLNNKKIVDKCKCMNNAAKESVFISSEHQIKLNKMIDIILESNTD
jgi:hypothetical protein